MIQAVLPQRLLSGIARRISLCRLRWFKNGFIRVFCRLFAVELHEAQSADPEAYPNFDAFFTRALRPECRPLATGDHVLVCPSDGTISQVGRISGDRILQAKGRYFSCRELLTSASLAKRFSDGHFMTIYLSPRDYHRVHMPADGRLTHEIHVPGRLFSVSERSARSVPNLFARNERLVLCFDTDHGPLGVVMVAAMLVSGIETAWRNGIYPAPVQPLVLPAPDTCRLRRGAELGRFHWGSTVLVLRPAGAQPWLDELIPGTPVRMGQALVQAVNTR